MSKVLCIYHANCADGLGAAWAVHRALGDGVEFWPASYSDDTDEYSNFCAFHGRDILIVDFSYPLPILRAMAAEARSVLILDHHKTAREDLIEIGMHPAAGRWKSWLQYNGETNKYNLAAIFDMNRSGAGIAWDYLHPLPRIEAYRSVAEVAVKSRPHIIDLIEDRDLWRFKYGDESRAFHAVLASYNWADLPAMFKWLDELNSWYDYKSGTYEEAKSDVDWGTVMHQGRAILRARQRDVATAVAASRRTMRIAGHVVPPSMASEAGHLLCEDILKKAKEMDVEPLFSATYHDGSDGRRHFSLRSPEGGADVGEIAQRMAEKLSERERAIYPSSPQTFTGGGHAHAAGFDAPLGWEGE
jgi:hypothetical protein